MSELRNVQGLSDCLASLKALPKELRKKGLGAATNAATVVVRDEARRLAPEYSGPVGRYHPPPGTLRKAIILKRASENCTDQREAYVVTVRRGKAAKQIKKGKMMGLYLDAYYWFWVEFGSMNNRPIHYMRDAFKNKVGAAIDKFATVIKERVFQLGSEKPKGKS